MPRKPTTIRERYESKDYLILADATHSTVRLINRTTTILSPCVLQNIFCHQLLQQLIIGRNANMRSTKELVTENVMAAHASARARRYGRNRHKPQILHGSTIRYTQKLRNRKEFHAVIHVLQNESRTISCRNRTASATSFSGTRGGGFRRFGTSIAIPGITDKAIETGMIIEICIVEARQARFAETLLTIIREEVGGC